MGQCHKYKEYEISPTKTNILVDSSLFPAPGLFIPAMINRLVPTHEQNIFVKIRDDVSIKRLGPKINTRPRMDKTWPAAAFVIFLSLLVYTAIATPNINSYILGNGR
jgi:hypothetical protein